MASSEEAYLSDARFLREEVEGKEEDEEEDEECFSPFSLRESRRRPHRYLEFL